jgi:hypothetical protein
MKGHAARAVALVRDFLEDDSRQLARAFLIARSTLSAGMLASRALITSVRSRALPPDRRRRPWPRA